MMPAPAEKVYMGKRQSSDGVLVWVMEGKLQRPLRHHVYHSPTGFEWGYYGSGPADLARSICWDVLGRKPHLALYQRIKERFVAKFGDEWTLRESEVRAVIARLEGL